MKRWNIREGDHVENLKIDAFIEDVVKACQEHDLSISHEDGHGAFEIELFSNSNIEWLMDAHDRT